MYTSGFGGAVLELSEVLVLVSQNRKRLREEGVMVIRRDSKGNYITRIMVLARMMKYKRRK